jgi:hypothetical protein
MRILARDKELVIFEDGDRLGAAKVILETDRDDVTARKLLERLAGKMTAGARESQEHPVHAALRH